MEVRAQRIKESLQTWNKEKELKALSELGKMRIFDDPNSGRRRSRDKDVDLLVRAPLSRSTRAAA